MRLLLDTHTALWMFAGSPEISPALEQDLTDPANDLFFSDASAWEIVIKHSLGKLALPSPPEVFVTSPDISHRFYCGWLQARLAALASRSSPDSMSPFTLPVLHVCITML